MPTSSINCSEPFRGPGLYQEVKDFFDQAYEKAILWMYAEDQDLGKPCAYALSGAGKRVRPMCCLLSSQVFNPGQEGLSKSLRPALALEWIHTYSLVHDDLPSMDNDDYRRGRPTVHRVFGEALGVLTGDALLTDAFGLLSGLYLPWVPKPSFDLGEAFGFMVEALGSQGMVLGQAMDMAFTAATPQDKVLGKKLCQKIQLNKTAKLMGLSFTLGALAAGASPREVALMEKGGIMVGLVFQMIDDLLDEKAGFGKTPGKDDIQGKLTILSYESWEEGRLDVLRQKRLVQDYFHHNFGSEKTLDLLAFFESFFSGVV